MGSAGYWFLGLAALAAAILLLRFSFRTFFRFRGTRLVTCPENSRAVAVEVDAVHAAVSREGGQPALRLKSCTRWPEKEGCGQECLRQIEERPLDCLVKNVVVGWYRGKSCVYCGKEFGQINWHDHKPALRDARGVTVKWDDVPPESLPEVLASHQPVCWNCHVAETFRRLHPEMITDRDYRR